MKKKLGLDNITECFEMDNMEITGIITIKQIKKKGEKLSK